MLPFLQCSCLKKIYPTWAYVVVSAPRNDDVSVLFSRQDEIIERGLHELGILLDHASYIPAPL